MRQLTCCSHIVKPVSSSFAAMRRQYAYDAAGADSLSAACEVGDMPVIYPKKSIASRWHGALAARLRREPLERFLAAHAIDAAPPGPSCVGEQLAAGARVFLGAMLDQHHRDSVAALITAQHYVIAQSACAVSETLARLIGNPASWRIAALMSARHALSPMIGVDAAAHQSAVAVRIFPAADSRMPVDRDLFLIESAVTQAVTGPNTAAFDDVVEFMTWRLRVCGAVSKRFSSAQGTHHRIL